MRPIITSRKHLVQIPVDSVMGGTLKVIPLANALQNADHAVATNVNVGATIKAIYVEMWIMAEAQNIGSITLTVEKLEGTQPEMIFAQNAVLHNYANKKNIFYTTQGLTGENDTNPIPFLRAWIKIPKGKQRFGSNDRLVINLAGNTEDARHCGLVIFKDYT